MLSFFPDIIIFLETLHGPMFHLSQIKTRIMVCQYKMINQINVFSVYLLVCSMTQNVVANSLREIRLL